MQSLTKNWWHCLRRRGHRPQPRKGGRCANRVRTLGPCGAEPCPSEQPAPGKSCPPLAGAGALPPLRLSQACTAPCAQEHRPGSEQTLKRWMSDRLRWLLPTVEPQGTLLIATPAPELRLGDFHAGFRTALSG